MYEPFSKRKQTLLLGDTISMIHKQMSQWHLLVLTVVTSQDLC